MLADREALLGSTDPATLGSRLALARAYQQAGRLAEALPLFEAVVADFEATLGAAHPHTLASRQRCSESTGSIN